MPASPDLASALAKEIAEVYADATATMLNRVADRLARGIDQPGWAEAKLVETAALRADARAVVNELNDTAPKVARAAVTRAAERGADAAATDLRRAGVVSGRLARTNPATVEALARETVGAVTRAHPRILRVADDIYRSVIADATGQVATGVATRREAAQRALDRFAVQGVTGMLDSAGRSWAIESYAEMAVRTSAGRAAVAGYTGQLVDGGIALGYVSTSPAPCDICDPWEGQILSLDGTSGEYPSLAEAEADGLFHPNCTHAIEGYIDGVTETAGVEDLSEAERADRYAAKQEQRRIERGIREWKRREAVALDDAAASRARGKVREWQAKARANDDAAAIPLRQRAREQTGRAR
jgi:hypothetical protein